MKARASRGFTILEIMLAISILGFLTALLFGTFSRTSRIKRQIESAQERIHVARVALLRISREIEMAFISEHEDPTTAERRTMFVGKSGDSDELTFSWFGHQRLRSDGADADTSLVMYYLGADPDQAGVMNLMRRESYRLDKTNDPRRTPGESYVLCPNIRRLKINYYDYKKKEWKDSWNTQSADGEKFLPTHVRIWLTIVDERGEDITYFTSSRIVMTEVVGYRPGQ